MKRRIARLALLLALATSSGAKFAFAQGYFGGVLKPHNHTSAAGDGGLLSNLVVSGFQDKGGQVYNIQAYGATTAAADNTSAITLATQAAAANGGGTIYIPPGTWNYSTTIALSSNTILSGSGVGASVLNYTGASTGVVLGKIGAVAGTTNIVSRVKIKDLTLNTSTGQIGIGSYGSYFDVIDHVQISGTSKAAIDLSGNATTLGSVIDWVQNCNIQNNNGIGILLDGYDANAIYVLNNNISNNGGIGLYGSGTNRNVTVTGNTFEANTTNELKLDLFLGFNFSGNYVEFFPGSAGNAIVLGDGVDAAGGASITGNYIHGDVAGSTAIYSNAPVAGLDIRGNDFSGFYVNVYQPTDSLNPVSIGPNQYRTVGGPVNNNLLSPQSTIFISSTNTNFLLQQFNLPSNWKSFNLFVVVQSTSLNCVSDVPTVSFNNDENNHYSLVGAKSVAGSVSAINAGQDSIGGVKLSVNDGVNNNQAVFNADFVVTGSTVTGIWQGSYGASSGLTSINATSNWPHGPATTFEIYSYNSACAFKDTVIATKRY